jgi:hypothetical protein
VRRHGQEGRCATATAHMTEPTKKPSKTRQRTGLRGLMSRISVRGMKSIDRRSRGYRALLEWQHELERDLGGVENLSAQQRTIIELACRSRLFLDSIDGWLLTQDSVVNKRARAVFPIFRERQALSDQLAKLLERLGLERAAPAATSLQQYIADKEKEPKP